jgi:hypothetical protein
MLPASIGKLFLYIYRPFISTEVFYENCYTQVVQNLHPESFHRRLYPLALSPAALNHAAFNPSPYRILFLIKQAVCAASPIIPVKSGLLLIFITFDPFQKMG